MEETLVERRTYGEWRILGRQVQKGQRAGPDGKFSRDQTKERYSFSCAACDREDSGQCRYHYYREGQE
jgi:hypothetical protein